MKQYLGWRGSRTGCEVVPIRSEASERWREVRGDVVQVRLSTQTTSEAYSPLPNSQRRTGIQTIETFLRRKGGNGCGDGDEIVRKCVKERAMNEEKKKKMKKKKNIEIEKGRISSKGRTKRIGRDEVSLRKIRGVGMSLETVRTKINVKEKRERQKTIGCSEKKEKKLKGSCAGTDLHVRRPSYVETSPSPSSSLPHLPPPPPLPLPPRYYRFHF